MLLAFLSYLNVFYTHLVAWSEVAKSQLRTWLGPAPLNYYLLADGRVVPTSTQLPQQEVATANLFEVQSNRIVPASNPAPQGRFRPIPFVSAVVNHPVYGATDLTDWIGELRANPVPDLRIQQLLQLFSLVHNVFVPIRGVTINVVKNDGEEDILHFD